MRVSVTITDEMNDYFISLAKEKGISKDKAMGSVLSKHFENSSKIVGRPERSDIDRDGMLLDRDCGMSIRKLAAKYKCSVGTVHKYLMNSNGDGEE